MVRQHLSRVIVLVLKNDNVEFLNKFSNLANLGVNLCLLSDNKMVHIVNIYDPQ